MCVCACVCVCVCVCVCERGGGGYCTCRHYFLHGRLYNDPNAGWEVGESLFQQTVVCDAVLLKAVEEGCRCVLHLRLLHDHNTLKVRVHTGRLHVSPNGNVGVVASTPFGIINLAEMLVKEVIKAFMYVICLCHQYCVAFNG